MRRIGIFLTNRKVRVAWLCVLCWLMLNISDLIHGEAKMKNASIGGGGTSKGGSFTLTGTIGQPITDSSSGGPYVLTSGFLPAHDRTEVIPLEPEPEPEPAVEPQPEPIPL